ncbi:coiled-coil domain-containing protein 106-like [Labeo rohita]|uniref:Coiled-coil domain-containing protein 106-like n=1 Tax=Labeo rohita TaxID=84645 RepID=A0A498L6W5_LABRO|nr:coiled-coil domain-containing protein 106-like [Labeo rohita]
MELSQSKNRGAMSPLALCNSGMIIEPNLVLNASDREDYGIDFVGDYETTHGPSQFQKALLDSLPLEQLRTAEKLTGSSQPITHFTETAARPPPPTTKCSTSTTTRPPSSLNPTVVKLLPPPTIQCSIPPPENLPTSPSRPSSPSNKTDTRGSQQEEAPTAQMTLSKTKQTVEMLKEKTHALEEKVESLTEERNFLRERLEDDLKLKAEIPEQFQIPTASQL